MYLYIDNISISTTYKHINIQNIAKRNRLLICISIEYAFPNPYNILSCVEHGCQTGLE